MAGCEAGTTAGRRVIGEGRIGLKLEGADGGVLLVVNDDHLRRR